MRRLALVPFALLALAPFASAGLVSYRVSGVVDESATRDPYGTLLPPSAVTGEFTVGTPIDLTFSYDPEIPRLATVGFISALYDLPYTISGRIGDREFSANAGTVSVIDSDFFGDSLDFLVRPGDTTAGVTPVTLTEASPFTGSGHSLTSIRFGLGSIDGAAFSGSALPSSLAPSLLQRSRFELSYRNAATGATSSVTGSFRSLTPVPEPASLVALGLGFAALARRRPLR